MDKTDQFREEAERFYPLHDVFSKDERDAYIKGRQQSAGEVEELRREVKKLRDGLGEVLKEYEYSCKLMAEANGMVWSENNVSISAKQLLAETDKK